MSTAIIYYSEHHGNTKKPNAVLRFGEIFYGQERNQQIHIADP